MSFGMKPQRIWLAECLNISLKIMRKKESKPMPRNKPLVWVFMQEEKRKQKQQRHKKIIVASRNDM